MEYNKVLEASVHLKEIKGLEEIKTILKDEKYELGFASKNNRGCLIYDIDSEYIRSAVFDAIEKRITELKGIIEAL